MRKELKILTIIALVVIGGALVAANYYGKSAQSEAAAAFDERLVRSDSPSLGRPDAPITLVEFLDPECEACAAFTPVVKQILSDYDGKVRLVVRYMAFHRNSVLAANFLEAAGEQGKYWEMQEQMIRGYELWADRHGAPSPSGHEPPAVVFERFALQLGLDLPKVRTAVAQNRYTEKVRRDMTDGQSLGVRKTPTFFVNGQMLMRFSERDLRALIEQELQTK
jgi:protein-disulfide isomerase